MTIFILKLIIVVLNCVSIHASTPSGVRYERLSGPKMCRELCQEDSFLSISEFRCFKLLTDHFKNTQHRTTMICLKKTSVTNCRSLKLKTEAQKFTTKTEGNNPCQTLYMASKRGDACLVDYVLSNGFVDIDCRVKSKETPVMAATRHNHVRVFDLLVKKGCDLSVLNSKNNTVLHIACATGNAEIARKLTVELNYDTDVRGWRGWTPLMDAAYYGHLEVFDLLVSKGCSLSACSEDKDNILHFACIKGRINIIKRIVSHGMVNIDSRGMKGRTAVLQAARRGLKNVVKFLASIGCNLTIVDDQNNNILHLACANGSVDMVSYILSQEIVSRESRGRYGQTPLMIAAARGHLKTFGFLMTKGCDLMATDKFDESAFLIACRHGHVDLVKHILSHNESFISQRVKTGMTPVMFASAIGNIKVVNLLISKGCNLKTVDERGNNILHHACMHGRLNVMKYLITQKGVEKYRRNKAGRTPLQEAEIKGYTSIVSLLKHS